jgi:hypothetical protein
MSNKKLTIKISGNPEDVNNLVDFLPLDLVDYMSEAFKNSEAPNSVHRFLKLNAKQLAELRELQKEVTKQFMEGVR